MRVARWSLLIQKYPKASSYLEKRFGEANFCRWGAPWLQVFTCSTTSSSRGEGANKDLKAGLKRSCSLTLPEAYDHIEEVQQRKKVKEATRVIRQGTAYVDALKLSTSWFPEISAAPTESVSGYCKDRLHHEMGCCGNYSVATILEQGALPVEEMEAIGLGATVEESDNLDLTAFTHRFDDADLREKDPFRKSGIKTFLEKHPEVEDYRIMQVDNIQHQVS